MLDFMSTCKFNTVEAENGRIALEEMRKPENDFDLVLLDLMMPEMNGYEVLAEMKDDPKLSEIPVVVMSATDSQDSVSQCLCKFIFLTYNLLIAHLSAFFVIQNSERQIIWLNLLGCRSVVR